MSAADRGLSGAAQALRGLEEQAKTLATRAQAALLDDHKEGALRSFRLLHELLVPAADAWLVRQLALAEPGRSTAPPLSSAAGLPGLWRELPDLDCERDSIVEALLQQAAHAGDGDGDDEGDGDAAYALALDESTLAQQLQSVQERLRADPAPRSRYFRRLARRTRGSLGDRARVQVQRGAVTVLERLPVPESVPPAAEPTTFLGRFQHGDRMTLQWQNPLPGQVAVVHAVGDEHDAELTVLVPQDESESVPRRHHEIIEVVGELLHVPGAEHALLILWVPELVPPHWVSEVLLRHRLPPDSRLWRYRYEVAPAARASE